MRRSSSLSREGGMDKPGQRRSAIPQLRRSSSQPPPSLGIRSSLTRPSKSPHHQTKSPCPSSHFPLPHYLASATPSERGSSAGMFRNSLTRFSLADKRSIKDPRNLMDKNFQIQELKKLAAFLKRKNAPITAPSRVPGSTFKREFFENFEYLANLISPFDSLSPSSPEDDVLSFLKFFGYPHNFTKSAILSSSSNQSCSRLLGILFWMRDLAEYHGSFKMNHLMVKDNDFEEESKQMKMLLHTANSYNVLIQKSIDQRDEDEKFFKSLCQELFGSNKTLELKVKMCEELFDKKLHLEDKIESLQEVKRKIKMIEIDCQKFEVFLPELEKRIESYEKEVQEANKLYQKKLIEKEKNAKELLDIENKVMQQRLEFSNEAFKQDKKNEESKIQELKNRNHNADSDCAEKEMINSKKSFELSNECSKVDKHLSALMETLKLQNKDLPQPTDTLPDLRYHILLKNQPELWKDQLEPWVKNVDFILKNKLRAIIENNYHLLAHEKELDLKKSSLLEDLKNVEKDRAQQGANFTVEEQRLEGELKNAKLEYDFLKEETNKIILDSIPSSSLKHDCLKLENKLRSARKRNDELQESYNSQLNSLVQKFNQLREVVESRKSSAQQNFENRMAALKEKYDFK